MSVALANPSLEALRSLLARPEGLESHTDRPKTLPLDLPSIDAVLPDGGLLRGAVVEVASPRGLGRATSLALAACASAQSLARRRSGDAYTVGAWCAFIDPWATLHASGALAAGVDMARLLVVRPPLEALSRVAVRVASSHAFSVVVIDTVCLPGACLPGAQISQPADLSRSSKKAGQQADSRINLDRWATIVRRLALAVERADTTVLLLTDSLAHRAMPLPVAMRIEVERSESGASLRVAKDRRGRISSSQAISFERGSALHASKG